MSLSQETIDCRGLQCPEPILRVARAAREMKRGTLTVKADDDAFPLDLKSWCRSAGAELLKIERSSQGYSAQVRLSDRSLGSMPLTSMPLGSVPVSVHASLPTQPAPPLVSALPGSVPERVLDCRGKQCPEPILELARVARVATTGAIRISADDPAFPLDLRSWCRTTGATIVSLDTQGSVVTAVVQPATTTMRGRSDDAAPPTSKSSAAPVPSTPSGTRLELDLTQTPAGDIEGRLAPLGMLGADAEARVHVANAAAAQLVLRWVTTRGHEILGMSGTAPVELRVRPSGAMNVDVPSSAPLVLSKPNTQAEYDCALLVLHNDLEALLAAMLIANGAAAQGMRTVVFFTFWGLNLLRGDHPNLAAPREKVSLIQRIFKWFMPRGPKRQQLGQLNFGGAGPVLLKGLMKKQNITDLPRLIDEAQGQGVRFVACTMSMGVMGITRRDLAPYPNLDFGGVSFFVGAAREAQLSLVF